MGSTITPGKGWALGTPTSPSRLMSRHISAKEAWGLVQVRLSGWSPVAEQPTGTPHQPHSQSSLWGHRSWGHDALSLSVRNTRWAALRTRKVFQGSELQAAKEVVCCPKRVSIPVARPPAPCSLPSPVGWPLFVGLFQSQDLQPLSSHRARELLTFGGAPKNTCFADPTKSRSNFDSFTPDDCCCGGCCYFFYLTI